MKNELKALVKNEAQSWDYILGLRRQFNPSLFSEVKVGSRKKALDRGLDLVNVTLSTYETLGLDIQNLELGHGMGHLTRDYVNTLTLLQKLEADPKHIFIGLVGGILHDTGCALVERYTEPTRAVRHAEAGAILFNKVSRNIPDLNEAERILLSWGIAAHTNYPSPQKVECSDGVTRKIEPYQDLDETGNPILGIWLPRWIDRLDCNGPSFVGRHYLTLSREHKDFNGKDFYDVDFKDHMRPTLRSRDQIKRSKNKRTMSEHLKMFADSQNNDSPYGKHDFGKYIALRDSSRAMLIRILNSTQNPLALPLKQREDILLAWDLYLKKNISPTDATVEPVAALSKMFHSLDDPIQNSWARGFLTTMREYETWASERLEATKCLPDNRLSLPAITENIRAVIHPHPSWVKKIN